MKTGQAPECGNILILFADRFTQPLKFYGASGFCQLLWVDGSPLQSEERLEQRGGETSGRAEAGPARDVCHGGDFKVVRQSFYVGEAFPQDRMLDRGNGFALFEFGVFQQISGNEP